MSLGHSPTPPEYDENLAALNELKGYMQSAKQGLGYVADKVDKNKGLLSSIATGLGAVWAGYEIYQNPANVARFATHTQLPTAVVNTSLVALGMAMTGVPTAITLFGGNAIKNQVTKGRKRKADDAALDETGLDVPAPPAQETNTLPQTNDKAQSVPVEPFTFRLDLPEDALMPPNNAFLPGANSAKRRKLNVQAEDSPSIFKTPSLSPKNTP